MARRGPDSRMSLELRWSQIGLQKSLFLRSWGGRGGGGLNQELGQGESVCGTAQMSHLPHSVGGITGAVLVTDEAIETWGTESLLAIRPFKPCFTQTGSIDVMTLGSVLTLTPLVTLRTEAAHRTVVLTPGGHMTLSLKPLKNIKNFRTN